MDKDGCIDLERRTVAFSVQAINLLRVIPPMLGTDDIKMRMVRAATSCGASYREAICSADLERKVRKLESAVKALSECAYWVNLLRELYRQSVPLVRALTEACAILDELKGLYQSASLRLVCRQRAYLAGAFA